jgi:very-short-patch-repair endonuclease
MDEASQMKPEDALGAIARGRQLVVVGDPKQLPPTTFFDKVLDDDEADSAAIVASESILDSAMPMFDARRLRWHYRSKHESLIAFSNHAFYDDRLVVFPAPYSASEEFGVKFTRVSRGRFVNRRNVEEARVIAMAVQRHLLHRPDESLGVVAMSAEQRDQIERAVEELSKDDPLFREALEQSLLLQEPLFIKNLENVQGDERDVIFISCTYGPEEIGGKPAQRFGPINTDVGWRRLNVLFTRAKKRMHVFSSMGAEDIVLSEGSKRGVEAFKTFLSFAETGHLHQAISTGRAPDSDFEVAVAHALGRAGFHCVPQVGVAGFFIDVAVRDPGKSGRYLMGIECDGASYHSAKSVRDRDRLRQTVLEGLGWHIRRIWSTDWYRNPQAEIEPIMRELNALKTEVSEEEPQAAEAAEVREIVEKEEQRELLIDTAVPEGVGLREKLVRFDREVIRSELPGTPENRRLLRPAMVEALLEFMPITKSEFVEMIPLYLRQATSGEEGKYLDQVLSIIEQSEVDVKSVAATS